MHSLANIRPEPLAPSDLLLETERLRLRPLRDEDLDLGEAIPAFRLSRVNDNFQRKPSAPRVTQRIGVKGVWCWAQQPAN